MIIKVIKNHKTQQYKKY